MRKPDVVPVPAQIAPVLEDGDLPECGTTFAVPTPGRERLYGTFDSIPPQASTARNIANRKRVIE